MKAVVNKISEKRRKVIICEYIHEIIITISTNVAESNNEVLQFQGSLIFSNINAAAANMKIVFRFKAKYGQ